MRNTSTYFACGICAKAVGVVDNDLPGDMADTNLPPTWAQVIVRRVMPDPDYQSPETAEQMTAKMIQGLPEGTPPEQADQLRQLSSFIHGIRGQDEADPMFVVDDAEIHLCHEHAILLGALDPEACEEAGWENFAAGGNAALAGYAIPILQRMGYTLTAPAPVPAPLPAPPVLPSPVTIPPEVTPDSAQAQDPGSVSGGDPGDGDTDKTEVSDSDVPEEVETPKETA